MGGIWEGYEGGGNGMYIIQAMCSLCAFTALRSMREGGGGGLHPQSSYVPHPHV